MTSKYAHLTTGDEEWDQVCIELSANNKDIVYEASAMKAQAEDPSIIFKTPAPEDVAKIDMLDLRVPVKGGSIPIKTYKPKTKSETGYPALVWIHGGGWMIGKIEWDDAWLASLCAEIGLSIVNVGYRLSPEHQFPTQLEDCQAALTWTVENQHLINANISNGFIVGGSSAGGNLSAALSLVARDDPALKGKLTGQFLSIPCVIAPNAVPEKWKADLRSFTDLSNAPDIPEKVIRFVLEHYVGTADISDWRISPLLAPSHAGLPPAVIYVSGHDPLRDEGILYSKVLEEAGVKTKLYIYPATPHGHYHTKPETKAAQKYFKEASEGIKWILSLTKG